MAKKRKKSISLTSLGCWGGGEPPACRALPGGKLMPDFCVCLQTEPTAVEQPWGWGWLYQLAEIRISGSCGKCADPQQG